MVRADLSEVQALERRTFTDAWPISSFEDVLNGQNWHGVVAEMEGRIVAYACALIVAQEAHLANLAVDPAYRRKSVAKVLLDHILRLAAASGCELVLLEVRPSNKGARKFYEQAGFVELYQRPDYYKKPVEDAVIMTLHLRERQGQE
jgi:ribosomal-protein-alanine N-acetyltransferase